MIPAKTVKFKIYTDQDDCLISAWIEINRRDGSISYRAYVGNLEDAKKECAAIAEHDSTEIDSVLLLGNGYCPGTIATPNQIMGEWKAIAT
jgi:hypothetical protein